MASVNERHSCSAAICIFTLLFVLVTVTEVEAAFLKVVKQPTIWRQASGKSGAILTRPRHTEEQMIWSSSTPLYQLFSDISFSMNFAMDPESDEARELTARLGLTIEQHEQLSRLASLVVNWNERINLVSRKDCNVNVVFGRHVLPSIALAASEDEWSGQSVIDVGTGGGFPGLPLAICYPRAEFMLVDSVGKKLKAVEEMAKELGLTNVRVHHGRAEEMTDDILEGSRHEGAYDVCLGRSVAALPKFCFWISELIKPESGRLVYIIGGELDEALLSQADSDVAIDDVLEQDGASDKRILKFDQEAVARIAAASGEVKQKRGKLKAKVVRNKQRAKGQWTKRDNKPKQRGYEDFKRY